MATSVTTPLESPPEVYRQSRTVDQSAVPSEELLDLLGDEYTRRVLDAVIEEPRTGSEIIDVTSVSKPTVYRRLNALEDAGIVTSELSLDPEGHHCEQFRAVAEQLSFTVDEDGVRVQIRRTQSDTTGPEQSGRRARAGD